MSKKEVSAQDFIHELRIIEKLLILLIDKQGVQRGEIAKVLGVSEGELSKTLNPKKYK
jgi:DNA-directed RNA polymerase specialized sigma subunit